jgi:thioesterase domain-containing protein
MMSNEEFDRRMEFFLNHQAQFDAEMEKFQETQKELQRTTNATAEGLEELRILVYEGFKLSAERFEVVSRNFEVVSEKFNRTDDMIKALSSNTDAKINALIDAQLRTEEKIKKTDAKLDHHLNEDHNGGRKPNTS